MGIGLTIVCVDFHENQSKIATAEPFFFTFNKIKDGGESVMTHYDLIGCIEVGMIHGTLFLKIGPTGQKLCAQMYLKL